MHDDVDLSLEIWQYLQSVIVSLDGEVKASEQQARDLAGAFLFSGSDQEKVLADVSGGERSRAVLAGLIAGAHNLLLLDEPSNHLDIPSAERLEQALSMEGGYDGTLLLISHDRALLEATCNRLIVFDGAGRVTVFDGRYSEWQHRQEQLQKAELAERKAERKAAEPPRPAPVKTPPPKPDADRPHAGLKMSELERRIEKLEARRSEIDASMSDPEIYTDGDRCRALQSERQDIGDQLGPLEDEWALRAES